MSYWSNTNSSAAGQSYGPPPLPPRNDGSGRIGAPGAVPPPIPPRPAGFGYQQVRDPGSPKTPNQTQGYSDISHFFPGGKIPPPPPRPGASPSPQPSVNAGRSNAVVSLPISQAQPSTSNRPPRTTSEGNQRQHETQYTFSSQATSTPIPADAQGHTGSIKEYTVNPTGHDVGNNPARAAGSIHQASHEIVNNNMATMNKTFESMGLGSSSDATSDSREEGNNVNYHAYPPLQSSNPAPTRPAKAPLPTEQTTYAHSATASGSTTSPMQPQAAAKECISTTVTFAATWYTHPQAPEYLICMNCYESHIRDSRFKDDFRGTFCDDGQGRACGFNSSRIRESLWKLALSSGSLNSLLEYMILRPSIPGCRGQGGAKAGSGIKWYRARNNDIPAMAVCQACYEDDILAHPQFGRDHFEPFDAGTVQQHADDMWSCDIAVPYINREYRVRALTNDWRSFIQGVNTRLSSFYPCPGETTVYPDGKGRKWFTPINGPHGLLICGVCYYDYILLTGQEGEWRDAGGNLVEPFGVSVSCFFGPQYNVRVLASRMLDTNDYAMFWKAMDVVIHEPRCKGRIQSSSWYTLHSNPNGFEICRACYATIAEPMGIGHRFKPKTGIAPNTSIMCSFNTGVARFPVYMTKLMEMVYKQDPAPLEEFVKEYAFMPVCPRDSPIDNARWYGWTECTICPECYHEFIRRTALANSMPNQGTLAKGSVMCEMYSPRMRQLYLAACASDPPDPRPLLEFSAQRRAVWTQTIPQAKQIRSGIQLKIYQQRAALNNSMFYTNSGNLFQATLPVEQTFGNSAIGYGHYNHMQIKGAEYRQQVTAIGRDILASPNASDELVRRWRLVE